MAAYEACMLQMLDTCVVSYAGNVGYVCCSLTDNDALNSKMTPRGSFGQLLVYHEGQPLCTLSNHARFKACLFLAQPGGWCAAQK